jgi:Peptidase M66
MVAFRTSFANTGRGFTITELDAPDQHGSPYSTQTAIAMGWALVNNRTDCTFCDYKSLGYWESWVAAASLGWCGMKAGDECGNTLSHELGHSMDLSHFEKGSALDWGIADEYPQDGTHLATHPWGYDTISRQFRTWYDVRDGSSKKGKNKHFRQSKIINTND